MSQNTYFIKFTNKEEYEINKNILGNPNDHYLIDYPTCVYLVDLRLTNEEYEVIKSKGLNINLDLPTIK
jgi:hypothetical protein